jgi:hypothetical protein
MLSRLFNRNKLQPLIADLELMSILFHPPEASSGHQPDVSVERPGCCLIELAC